MIFEEQIPEVPVALAVQTFADDMHAAAEADVADFGVGKQGTPLLQPGLCGLSVTEGMEQGAHEVRLTLTAFAFECHGATLIGAGGLECFEQVGGGVGDAQKIGRRDLSGPCVVVVGQFNRRAFETASFELFPQLQP